MEIEDATVSATTPREIMRLRARGHIGFLIGAGCVLLMVLLAIFAPYLTPYDPFEQNLEGRLINPFWGTGGSWTHPLGTDSLGRDYLTRILYGARISLTVGFGAALISGFIGSTLGILGGYFGGKVDAVVMYVVNVKLALPGILIALSLVSIIGGSLLALVCILGFLFWDRFAVVTRSVTQQIRGNDFVTAAAAVGASQTRIIFGEVLPNLTNQIIVVASLEMAIAILV